jgi:hypothetical protein
MNIDESFLTPAQQIRELEVMAECFRLMQVERSRYELQAAILFEKGSFSRQNGNYFLKYKIKDDRFVWHALPALATENSYSCEAPIPKSRTEQIEQLVEFFAQSEAGFIS